MKFLLILVIAVEALIRRTIRFHTIAEESHPYDMYFPEISGNGIDVQSARAVLLATPYYPQIEYVHEMTLEQRKALHVIDNNFMTKTILRRHRAWHSNVLNSVGGITGPGSGIALGGKHGLMLKEMEMFVGINWKRPKLDRSQMLDLESQMDLKFAPVGSRGTNFPNYYETPFPQRDNFLTADDWWRYKGLHDHAQFHQRVGGIMADNKNSPTDVFAFFGHHTTLQREFEEWLASPNGVIWKSNNYDHVLFTGSEIDFKDPSKFVNQGYCRTGTMLEICYILQGWQSQVDANQQALLTI